MKHWSEKKKADPNEANYNSWENAESFVMKKYKFAL